MRKCQRHDSPNQPHGRKNVDALRERNGKAELNGKGTFFPNLASLAESAFSALTMTAEFCFKEMTSVCPFSMCRKIALEKA